MQNIQLRRKTTEIDLFRLAGYLWSKKYLILLSTLIAGFLYLGFVYFFVAPKYEAKITLYANNYNTSDVSTSITTNDISASVKLVNTYAAIIVSDPVIDEVIENTGGGVSSEGLIHSIQIDAVNDTEVFTVKVKNTDPERAAELANEIANVAPKKIESIVEGCSVKVISLAKTPQKAVSPSYSDSFVRGAFGGFVLILAILILLELLDTSIKSADDMKYWSYPVLGTVPGFSEIKANGNHYGSYYYGYGYESSSKHSR